MNKVWIDEARQITCPRCKTLLVELTSMKPEDEFEMVPNDVVVCRVCAQILRVNEDCYLEEAPKAFLAALKEEFPAVSEQMQELQRDIRYEREAELKLN